MEEMAIITEATSKLPLWANVVIGITVSFGGLEFIKYLVGLFVNWRANKRKNSAEAKESEAVAHQQVATAGQQDADWRQKELELMTSFVDTAKKQYADLTQRYEELKEEKEEDHKIKQELRKEIRALNLWKLEQERKTEGLQRAFTESESRRIAAERLYCSREECKKRKPPIGTYSSDGAQPKPQPTVAIERKRDSGGRFVKLAVSPA